MTSSIPMICALLLVCSLPVAPLQAENPVGKTKRKTIDLREMNWKELQKRIAQQKGKVVVVDIWTTTCPSCLEKFPQFVALQKKYGPRVQCISVNCDYDGVPGKPPQYYRKHVLQFLRKQKATCENVLLTIPFLGFLNQIKLESTPALLVYDRNGKLVRRFDNDNAVKEEEEFTMKQVESLIVQLLRRK